MANTYWLRFNASVAPYTTSGLAPTFINFAKFDGTSLTPPGITAPFASLGIYQFSYTPSFSIAFVVDGATTGLSNSDRYIAGVLDVTDSLSLDLANTGSTLVGIGNTAIAIGLTNSAKLTNEGATLVAIGNSVSVLALQSTLTSLGSSVSVLALGTTLTAIGNTLTAIGTAQSNDGATLIAIGNSLSVLALGSTLTAIGTEQTNMGATLVSIGNTGIAIGSTTLADVVAQGSTLVGIGNTSIALGSTTIADILALGSSVSVLSIGSSVAAMGVTLSAIGLTISGMGNTLSGIGATLIFDDSALGASLLALDAKIGTVSDTFGTSSVDPTTLFGKVNRLQEDAEGQGSFNKTTGIWSINSRGGSLLATRTLTNTATLVNKS